MNARKKEINRIKKFIDSKGIKRQFIANKMGLHKSGLSNYFAHRFIMPEKHFESIIELLTEEYGYEHTTES